MNCVSCGHRSHRGRGWQQWAPWITASVALVEAVLVWTGWLALGSAVLIAVAVEVALWLLVADRVVAATRGYRRRRGAGDDRWLSAQHGLAQVFPRRTATFLLCEPRLWESTARWITGRHQGRSPEGFAHHGGVRAVFCGFIALTFLEIALTDLVLRFLLAGTPWPGAVLGLSIYSQIWIVGFYAVAVVRPHLLDRHALRIRDGVFTELAIPYAAITAARRSTVDNFGHQKLIIEEPGVATVANGEATVALTLDPDRPALLDNQHPHSLTKIRFRVDDPERFLGELTARLHERAALVA